MIVLIFPNAVSAERRIAGLPVVARAAAEAVSTGMRQIGVRLQKGVLDAETIAELRRVCKGASLQILGNDCQQLRTELIVYADKVLLTGTGIARLKDSTCNAMAVGDRLIASKAHGGATCQATADDAIDLTNTWDASRAILRRTAKSGDGLVSRYLNRPVSQFISALMLPFDGVRPWHATVWAAVLGVAMILALLFGGKTGLIVGGLLFHAASVIDGVDGEIARATFRSSRAGAILDTTIDMFTNLGFFLAVTIALARLYGSAHLWAGGWAVGAAAIGMLVMRDLSRRVGEAGNFNILKRYYTTQFPTGIPAGIVKVLTTLISRDMFALVFAAMIVLGAGAAVTYTLAGFVTLWVFLMACAAPGILHARAPYSSTASA